MTSQAERALWKAIKSRMLERAYYFFGEDEFLKAQAVRALVDATVDASVRDFNLDVRHGGELEAGALGSLLGTPPMMADRRVVVLRDVAALKKEPRAVLDEYLMAPAGDLLLVLVALGGEKAKADKLLETRAVAVEFEALELTRVPKWIEHHASLVHGATLTPGAIDLLARAVGNDLPALAAEIDKLTSFSSGGEITEEAVADIVGMRRGETLGDWMDLVGARDTAGALALLPHILEQPKTSAVQIVMILTVQTLALGWGEACQRDRGGRVDFYDFLKSSGGAFVGRAWGEATAAWTEHLDKWDAASIDAALAALLATDVALKETRLSSDDQLLASLVLAMCAPRATSLSRAFA
ncbi:MAG: DNA polymerase III subunit delta [Gemmatimonadaceae bacterium]